MESRTTNTGNDADSPGELYLDLLVQILTNMIYCDPPLQPEHLEFQPDLRAEGRDWPSVAHTMAGLRRLDNLRELAQRVIDEGIPGDFIETGVWRGGCCILLRGILAANAITSRKVYVADSFAGLPPPKPDEFPHDAGLNLHVIENWRSHLSRSSRIFHVTRCWTIRSSSSKASFRKRCPHWKLVPSL